MAPVFVTRKTLLLMSFAYATFLNNLPQLVSRPGLSRHPSTDGHTSLNATSPGQQQSGPPQRRSHIVNHSVCPHTIYGIDESLLVDMDDFGASSCLHCSRVLSSHRKWLYMCLSHEGAAFDCPRIIRKNVALLQLWGHGPYWSTLLY